MNNSNQVDTVKKALELEISISNTSQKLSRLLYEKFASAPSPPTRTIIERKYPEIRPTIKFNWLHALLPFVVAIAVAVIGAALMAGGMLSGGFVLSGISAVLIPLSLIWIPIYYFALHRKKQKENIEQIRNSVEYRNHCAAVDKEFDRMQGEADAIYLKQAEEYNTVILPKYEKDLGEWTAQHTEKVNETERDLRNTEEALNDLYESTKIVPLQYRKIEPLQFIYDMISTSDYDVRSAIEMYDRNEQRRLEEIRIQLENERLREQQYSNQLQEVNNQLQYEQNEINDRARRDANGTTLK